MLSLQFSQINLSLIHLTVLTCNLKTFINLLLVHTRMNSVGLISGADTGLEFRQRKVVTRFREISEPKAKKVRLCGDVEHGIREIDNGLKSRN